MKKLPLALILSSTLLFAAACGEQENATQTSENSPTETVAVAEETKSEATEEAEITSIENNNPTQERIDFLLDQAMYYYWHGGDLKKNEEEFFKGITLKGDQEVIEAIFNQVIELDPLNTDYQRSLAATMVINNKLDQAVAILKNIVAVEPTNYDALVQYYVYAGIQNDAFDEDILNTLKELNPVKTAQLEDDFKVIEDIRSKEVPTEIKQYEDNHLFVLLGYALDEDGKMQETMENRLNYALDLLEKNPTSKIILSGGVPKKGNTEASVMNEWLLDKGIDKDRIIMEGLATDTVENSLFSMRKAHELETSGKLTVISSASHVRRALSTFTTANRIINETSTDKTVDFDIDAVGEPDSDEIIKASDDKERLVVYRDVLRVEGFWQYPNLQR
jgi:Uncharacterized conserved protein